MGIDLSVKIGGQAGQGIQTVGQLLALVCRKAGLYLMAMNDFESRIRGGHNFFQLRISDHPVNAPCHKINLLVALDKKTLELHQNELAEDGLILIEGDEALKTDRIVPIPFTELSKKAGGKITANTIAAGACLALLGAPLELFKDLLSKQFGKKGQDIVEKNHQAAALGFQSVKDISFKDTFSWEPQPVRGMLMDGSRAVALGALAGDCRFAAFYPMSPATPVMSHLTSFTKQFPLLVEQVEDEIAAINVVIGASFAGVRAMTATSGGGFCLMTEGLGLAGITETPIVVVNAQRPGPATGLPTRTAQADLQFVIRASQDDFPRFVFAPGSAADAFEITARAFTLAEKYQVPAIILVDQYFNDSQFLTDRQLEIPQQIERFIAEDNDLENPEDYHRYALLSKGISPRTLPCKGRALTIVSGNEHRTDGHISEDSANRINMVDKRLAKVPFMKEEMKGPKTCHEGSDILLVGWGSTEGALMESVTLLRQEGHDVGGINLTDLWPFPGDTIEAILGRAKQFIMVEQNSTAQLGDLIREQTGLAADHAILKYDGRPFFPYEIVEELKKLL